MQPSSARPTLPARILARRGALSLGSSCRVSRGVVLQPHGGFITIGNHVHLVPSIVIYGHGSMEIGDECLIAMHCRIFSSEHTSEPAHVAMRTQPDILRPTRLERDVWLGAGVTVIGGVNISQACIVGGGAVVTRDLPAFSIAVGVPARVIGTRSAGIATHARP